MPLIRYKSFAQETKKIRPEFKEIPLFDSCDNNVQKKILFPALAGKIERIKGKEGFFVHRE